MRKTIRKILLKIQCIEQATLTRKAQQEDQRYHEHWAQLLRSGNTAREEDKTVESAGERVERPVFAPTDSINWGGMKSC